MRVHFGDFTLDFDARDLRRAGKPVHLSPKAFRALEVLFENRPAAVSKQRLFESVWPGTFVAESNLASVIKEIRIALGDRGKPTLIRTVFGYGYAFAGEVVVDNPPPRRIESIAVLRFGNSAGAEWDYVGDGIAEGLLNAFSRLPGIRVVPRSSSFRHRSADVDVRAVARELSVDALVTGDVSRREPTLTIQAELINATNHSQIWGGRFHGHESELLHIERQIEAQITAILVDAAVAHVRAAHEEQAYSHLLVGQHQLNRRDAEGFRRAIQELRTAAEIAPECAPARAMLAEAYAALGSRELDPPAAVFPLAREEATRAIELDPSIPGAHTALAAVQELFEWDWDGAEASHRKAVALEPHATAAQWFALHYARRALHHEAEAWIHHALGLEPQSPIINTNAALISYLAHDFPSAVRRCDRALDLSPHYEAAFVVRGVVDIQLDPRRAVEDLEEAARLSGRNPFALAHLASAYAAAGEGGAAAAVRDELTESAGGGYVSSALIAIAEIAVGNLGRALDALELAAGQRSAWISYILSEPRLDPLRGEPRFDSIVKSIGFGSLRPAQAALPETMRTP